MTARVDPIAIAAATIGWIPELVEVVYLPSSHALLIQEIARMRCEADEALEALEGWREKYWSEVVARASWDRPKLAELARLLDGAIDRVRRVQDPKA